MDSRSQTQETSALNVPARYHQHTHTFTFTYTLLLVNLFRQRVVLILLQSGSVRCMKKACPAAFCPHPVTNPCGCSICEGNLLTTYQSSRDVEWGDNRCFTLCAGCQFQGVTYADGQILPGEGGCQDCTCSVRGRGAAFSFGLLTLAAPSQYSLSFFFFFP